MALVSQPNIYNFAKRLHTCNSILDQHYLSVEKSGERTNSNKNSLTGHNSEFNSGSGSDFGSNSGSDYRKRTKSNKSSFKNSPTTVGYESNPVSNPGSNPEPNSKSIKENGEMLKEKYPKLLMNSNGRQKSNNNLNLKSKLHKKGSSIETTDVVSDTDLEVINTEELNTKVNFT